ncbi:major facilitator superfamily domain-containing protein [Mucor lusitanicus]
MSKSEEKPTDAQIERVESVHSRDSPAVNDDLSFKEFSDKEEHKKKNIFIRFKDSITRSLRRDKTITFAAAFFGWTLDAFDFFSVSLSATRIAEDFGVQPSDVTSAITTTLMLRPIGALIFGALADKYGRRWPLMIDIVLFSVINMASGFAPNLQTFIGLRAVFGIAMGGEWVREADKIQECLGASLALEALPVEARGLFSGIYQEGYACGFLLATLVNYAVVETGSSWRILFWVGAGFAILAVIIRIWVPESETFEEQKRTRKILGRSLWTETKLASRSLSYIPTQILGYTPTQQTVTNVIMNIGAICGGTIFGYLSNYFGRRLILCVCAICAGAFIPLWIYAPNIHALQFGAFVMQFFVQGGWGVIPAHINELAPAAFRGLIPGLAYQLGNLISAASSQIEATIGERYPLKNGDGSLKLDAHGKAIPDYGLTQAIFMGCVCGGLLITTLIGKEERNKDFKENLAEDQTGHGAIGPADVKANEIEQGHDRTSEDST